MKLVGIMPVRNEDWCLDLTARAALMWCDELVISLHACTDESSEIAQAVSAEHSGLVTLQLGPLTSEWPEMAHRQELLLAARAQGATHVAIIDADEILTCFTESDS